MKQLMVFSFIIRKNCIRIFLMLLLVLLVKPISAQTVIYPNGNSCANPGDVVTIYFPKKNGLEYSDYFFGTGRTSRWWGLAWSVENEFTPTKIDDNHFSIVVPQRNWSGISKYTIYYGRYKGLLYHYGSSSFDIRLCQKKPYLEFNQRCICPGSSASVTIHQSDNNLHSWQYKVDDKSFSTIANYDIVNDSTISFTVPTDLTSVLSVKADEDDNVVVDIPLCAANLSGPQCAPNKSTIHLNIENACPSLTYIVSAGRNTYKKNGSSSYDIPLSLNNQTTYTLKARKGNNETNIDELTVSVCNVTVSCPDFSSFETERVLSEGCSLPASSLLDEYRPTQNGGSKLEIGYIYTVDGGTEQELNISGGNESQFYPGHIYNVRMDVYVDDNYIKTCEVPEFSIKPFTMTCKDYSQLSADENISFDLPETSVGGFTDWSADNGFSVSGEKISGKSPFGETTEVSISAKKCDKTYSCTSKITLIKSATPCTTK